MFDWKDYLKIANEFLLASPTSDNAEAYYRCGISRAYYSVYNMSVSLIESKKLPIIQQNGEGSHQATIRVLGCLNTDASSDLFRLKFLRMNSDYKSYNKITEQNLSYSLLLATSINRQLFQ